MLDEIIDDAQSRMDKSVEALDVALGRIRTGRAHPSLLEPVKVSYYGTDTPLRQVANISVEDARTLSITPWEKDMVAAIEKAIINSNLGLNPSSAGMVIRVPMPPLTEETRKAYIRQARQETENARIAIRNIRRDANADFKELLKEKEITEDDEKRAHDQVQKLTDAHVARLDALLESKEKDLMTI
jgi:ribosome recycling factor